jgi:hypothetical protein
VIDAAWIEAATLASKQRDRGFLASPFMAEAARIELAEGPARRAAFLRDALRALIDSHRPRIAGLRLPPTVKGLIEKEYARIERALERAPDDHFDLRHHSMRCDFRIVGFGRTPLGVEHMEVGGVPRSLLWKGGLGQVARLARLFVQAGGPKPFYVGHLTHGIKPHAFLLAYNEKTQEFWHRNVAECLQMNPHIRGFLATSWLYDPQLAQVSPHLAFLRTGSLAHGAVLAHVGPTEGAIRYALAHSPERQRLYDEGKYVPKSHAVIWTRDAMLDWAGLR